jgi:hypothetical protein
MDRRIMTKNIMPLTKTKGSGYEALDKVIAQGALRGGWMAGWGEECPRSRVDKLAAMVYRHR